MYNDTIKVANKIISDTDLLEIFQKMNEEIKENIELCKQETIQNEKYTDEYQHWTVKNFDGTFKCTFNFYDDTNITVDNYDASIALFDSRLHEIKNLYVRYHFSYWIKNGFDQKLIGQSISMDIHEYKMNITVNLSSEDQKMNDVYELIKTKILNAPEKYDRIIKDKNLITYKVGFALGAIPSIAICTLLVLVPMIRQLYGMTYVLYPIATIIFGLMIGVFLFTGSLERLYSTLAPSKKYAGFDSTKGKSIYTDDIEDYKSKSEIIIGKNINNIKNRKEIAELEEKYTKFIPTELFIILVLSILVIVIGKFIQ